MAKKVLGLGVIGIAVAFALPGLSACSDKKSGLMLAITTDMKAPKDVNAVSVTVKTNDAIKHNVVGRVTPQGDILLPATLAIVEPEDPNASIKIRVMAFQERKARVLRDVRTSIPSGGRVALLRIPLNFVNDGSVTGEVADGVIPAPNPGTGGGGSSGSSGGPTDGGPSGERPAEDPTEFVPNCDNPEFTWIDGECKDAYIDPNSLPDFDESLIGAQEAGRCFDAKQCFANAIAVGQGEASGGGSGDGPSPEPRDASAPPQVDAGMDGQDIGLRAITLDRAACAVALNGANADRVNLAIVTPDTGECIRPGQCFIPLDKGGSSGWKDEGGRIKLPTFVCRLLEKPGLQLYASTDTCAAKQESNPICIEQNVGGVDPGTDGGTSAGATLVVAEDRPTSVLVGASEIYVAGATRIARVPLFGQPLGQAIPGGPSVAAPWRLAHGPSGDGFAATNGTDKGYLFSGSDGALRTISLSAAPGNGVAWTPTDIYWAIAGPAGGVYMSQFANDSAAKLPNPLFFATTAIASVGEAVVFADEAGNISGCFYGDDPNGICAPVRKGADTRIDALIDTGGFGYALSTKAVHRVIGGGAEGFQTELVGTVDASGVVIDGKYHPRSIAHNGPCVFVTTSRGVEWIRSDGGGAGTVLASAPAGRHAFGVAIGPATSGGTEGRPVVYFTLYAPLEDGGGLYATPLPVECGGVSQGGGSDVPDSGARACADPGSDCSVHDQCCSLQCIEGKCL